MIRERTVVVSPRLASALREEAARRDKPVEWCVERAWAIAWPRLARLAPPTPFEQDRDDVVEVPCYVYEHARGEAIYAERFASEAREALVLALAVDVLEDMIAESYRLARSLGWLVERAWCVAIASPEASTTWFASDDAVGDTAPMPRVD